MMKPQGIGWLSIIRLGLVQTALGAIVVLTTSTINRVMIVELALPAMLPGALVAIHYVIQILRPRWGYGSDVGGKRAPWIIGGMLVLAIGAVAAACATALMEVQTAAGIALALMAFVLIGIGVGASGTSLLALLAARVAPERRAPAATIVWLMMIAGMAITAATAGSFLDPFSTTRLIVVTLTVAAIAVTLTTLAVFGIESKAAAANLTSATDNDAEQPAFMTAFRQVWNDRKARQFGIFVFVSMLAFSAQDLILEPFAGHVFGLTPGESTKLSGTQHGGVLVGMILVAFAGASRVGRRIASLRTWTAGGCVASAAALLFLAAGGYVGEGFPLKPAVFFLGFSNGIFAVAAIGSMMGLAGDGPQGREGIRMGFWGAAQALAFGLGGFIGTAGVDLARYVFGTPVVAYTSVFTVEALMFLVSAVLAARLGQVRLDRQSQVGGSGNLVAGATGR